MKAVPVIRSAKCSTGICACAWLVAMLLQSCRDDSSHLFTRLPGSRTGIDFVNTLQENETANVLNYTYFYNGGGVAAGDINNDGLPDVLFTGNMVANRLFLNKGNFKFEDITESSGVSKMQGWCTGVTMVDIDNDGFLDIYICRSADTDPARRRNLLFINNRNATFTESAQQWGLADDGYSTQASFFDYDKDGDLDMFLANHSLQQYAFGGYENAALRSQQNPAFASKLYRNDGGHFTNVSREAGITSNVLSFGLNVMVSDYNNDGWPDLYVDNDFNEADYLFINQKNGSFREEARDCLDAASLYSMGSDAADYNNDGLTDLVSLDMQPEDNHMQKMHSGAENFDKFQMLFRSGFYYQYSRNMLHKNNGDGTFSEIGQLAGMSNTDWSWAALFCDFDNDGNKDLFISNGYQKDYTDMDMIRYRADIMVKERQGIQEVPLQEILNKMPSVTMPNYIYRNNGDNTFSNKINDWGLNEKTVSSGAAYADLDNDGDMDLVVSNINMPAGIYKNNATVLLPANNYLKIKLEGGTQNTSGIGAKVRLYCRNRLYYQEQIPVRGFQSAVDGILHFGIGENTLADSVEVIWPDDRKQTLVKLTTRQTLTLRWKEAKPAVGVLPKKPVLFKQDSGLQFLHTENNFADFTVQSLMPNYLSRQGPGMASADINGDGLEDVFLGAAKGKPSQVFQQTREGNFVRKVEGAIASDSLSEDVATAFFDADGDGDKDLYVASGGYEFKEGDILLQDRLYMNNGKGDFSASVTSLPTLHSSKGCVAAADMDADGDIDLFIGGRIVPGKYPLSPESAILLNNGKGVFSNATSAVAPSLQHVGMVTDAIWVDVNSDGQTDLVVVGEWMPLKVFVNHRGHLEDASAEFIHFPSTGWWNTIGCADFDGDGDSDLVIGNTGVNTQFRANSKEPLTLYYKDFDGNGSIDPILCYYIQGISYPAVSRDDLMEQVPVLKKKFLAYRSYADATISDIFSEKELQGAKILKGEIMETVLLQNNGSAGFVLKHLPAEAQYAPVYAITTDDVNHDGNVDIIMAGNNSNTRIKFGNYRANHGIVLSGDGKNNFTYLTQPETGLNVRDNVRNTLLLPTRKGKLLLFGVNDNALQSYRLE